MLVKLRIWKRVGYQNCLNSQITFKLNNVAEIKPAFNTKSSIQQSSFSNISMKRKSKLSTKVGDGEVKFLEASRRSKLLKFVNYLEVKEVKPR